VAGFWGEVAVSIKELLETLQYMWKVAVPMLGGASFTVFLSLITAFLSMPLGFILTLIRVGNISILKKIVGFYVWIMRGTPLLLQLFFIYFALPFVPVIGPYLKLERFPAACVAFVLNYAAYFCEIFRGGLLSVDKGQYEAAKVLGLGRFLTMTKIVIPQMIKVVLPPVSNECITLIKDTALITTIGVTEILYFGKAAVNRDVNPLPLLVAAVLYLAMNYLLSRLFEHLERKYLFE
jgi:polar amino acid transport system permease protein